MPGEYVRVSNQVQGSPYTISGTAPELRLEETDQTAPAGRYRVLVSGDAFYIQRAASASWGSATDLLQLSSDGSMTAYGMITAEVARTLAGGGGEYGSLLTLTGTETAAAFSGSLIPFEARGLTAVANTQNWTAIIGLRGVTGSIRILDTSQTFTVTGAAAFVAEPLDVAMNSANVTLSNLYGLYIFNASAITAGTLSNQYGIRIEDVTRGGAINVGISLGSDADIAIHHNAAAVLANTALGGILEGVPVTPVAPAANSLYIANITNDGDILIAASKAGTSYMAFMADASTGDTLLGVPTGQSADLYVAGTKVLDIGANLALYEAAASTANQVLTVSNTSNAAADSHAYLEAAVGGTISTGDPQFRLTTPGGINWYVAADNSINQRFTIGTGTTVGTSQLLTLNAVTPLTAATFQAYLWALNVTVNNGATIIAQAFGLQPRTYTKAAGAGTAVTSLASFVDIGAMTLAQTNTAITYDKAAGLGVVGPTAGASVTITHGSGIRVLTGGASVNVSGLYVETQTAGTTGNYQVLLAVSTGARPALANFAGLNAIDFAVGDTRLMIQTELGIELAIGNSTIQSNSATEMAFSVTNAALVVGSAGSVVVPYLAGVGQAAFTDAIGGNVDGAIGVNRNDTGPVITLEARAATAWLSVAITGYLMQNKVPWTLDSKFSLHPSQLYHEDERDWLDESRCYVCGEPMQDGEQATFWVNGRYDRGAHAIFGHTHLERDTYVSTLETRIKELEERVKVLVEA